MLEMLHTTQLDSSLWFPSVEPLQTQADCNQTLIAASPKNCPYCVLLVLDCEENLKTQKLHTHISHILVNIQQYKIITRT